MLAPIYLCILPEVERGITIRHFYGFTLSIRIPMQPGKIEDFKMGVKVKIENRAFRRSHWWLQWNAKDWDNFQWVNSFIERMSYVEGYAHREKIFKFATKTNLNIQKAQYNIGRTLSFSTFSSCWVCHWKVTLQDVELAPMNSAPNSRIWIPYRWQCNNE